MNIQAPQSSQELKNIIVDMKPGEWVTWKEKDYPYRVDPSGHISYIFKLAGEKYGEYVEVSSFSNKHRIKKLKDTPFLQKVSINSSGRVSEHHRTKTRKVSIKKPDTNDTLLDALIARIIDKKAYKYLLERL